MEAWASIAGPCHSFWALPWATSPSPESSGASPTPGLAIPSMGMRSSSVDVIGTLRTGISEPGNVRLRKGVINLWLSLLLSLDEPSIPCYTHDSPLRNFNFAVQFLSGRKSGHALLMI